ncbi:MAG: alpha/beta hydrolase [Verrucomicrobiales bacterium]|nr:alpha/beta hydrolase [Verrucomicrobiales bacterium]
MNRPRPSSRRRMIDWLLIVVGLPVAGWLFLRWFEQHNVYHPTRDWWSQPQTHHPSAETVRFRTADGLELSAWYLPAAPTSPHHRVAVLVSHGNGGNISHRGPLYALLRDLGVHVLAYDYRGYGQSQGKPSEQGTYADVEAAAGWLRSRGFSNSNIVAWGESLGGGVSSEFAHRHPDLRGLVLQSTYTSLLDLGSELFPFLPVRTVARYHYDTISKLPGIRVPVLVLHSREDTLIPFHHAERNFAAANAPKLFREVRGDHNDQPTVEPELFAKALREFLEAKP